MGKIKRYNVISLRISDQEKESLERVMQTTSKSVSTVMREALRSVTRRQHEGIDERTQVHE